MADAPLHESIVPFRESVRAFAEAAAFVRRYGDDRAYWESMRTLQELPFASTFHPFAVTAQWVIEQATSAEPSRVNRIGQSAHVPARQASSRQRIALVNRTPASAPLAPQAPATSFNRTTDPIALGRQTKPEATNDGQSMASNAWSVLVQVSKLLEELQPSGGLATGIGRALEGAGSGASDEAALRHTRSSSLAQIGRHTSEAGTAQASRIDQPPSGPASRVHSRGDLVVTAGEQESSLSLLGQAVATLWQTEGAVSPSQPQHADAPRPSSPVPRAPSLLVPLPLAAALPPPTAERPVPPGEQDRGRSNSAAPQARQDDEPLADRINRELIEQAWLRGVDLA